jgi:hypothetical protein
MTDSESRQQIESTIRTTRLIWLALMAGVAAYAGVTWYLTSTNDMALGGAGIPRVLLWIALGYMIASIAAAPVVEQAVWKNATAGTHAEIARAWSTEKIVGLAIREGAGLLGITVALLMGSGTWAVLFGAAAVGSIFLAAPERADLTARIYMGQGEDSPTPRSD